MFDLRRIFNPDAEAQPNLWFCSKRHTIILPPPCLTTGLKFLFGKAVSLTFNGAEQSSLPESSTVSSEHLSKGCAENPNVFIQKMPFLNKFLN